jgi:transcriptional regulator with XRE-family HTH domain
MFNAAQLRAARGFLDMSQRELSEKSGVSLTTIKRLEIDGGPEAANHPTLHALESFFNQAGLTFADGGIVFGPERLEDAARYLSNRAGATGATTATREDDGDGGA